MLFKIKRLDHDCYVNDDLYLIDFDFLNVISPVPTSYNEYIGNPDYETRSKSTTIKMDSTHFFICQKG